MGNNKVIYSGKLTVRYSMYDFIAAVRERPLLWDRKHSQFYMRDKRDQAWHEVSNQVCSQFAEATPQEKEKMVYTLIKRWKNTRDCFLRSLRLKDDKNDYGRRYIYDNELSFLLSRNASNNKNSTKSARKRKINFTTTSRTRSLRNSNNELKKSRQQNNLQSDFDSDFEHMCLQVGDIVKELNDVPVETLHASGDKATTVQETATQSEEINDIAIASDDAKFVQATTSVQNVSVTEEPIKKTTENVVENDADQCFFDSIKPMMRSLSLDRKLDFQIEVLKLLKHFRNK